jgi:hypothetical protein
MQTAQDVYSKSVEVLPASERLRLATLILEGLSGSAATLDYSDFWSEEDIKDVTAFSANHAVETDTDQE